MSPLGGFDQVVAISQKQLNDGLKYRYEVWKGPLQGFKAHSPDDKEGFIEATMSPPTIELYVPGEPQKAVFRLNFNDGHFDYPQGEDRKLQRQSMQGWSLAFVANLSPSKLNQVPSEIRDDIPKEVIEHIEQAGSYSLSQVLIDLGTANVVDFDFSRSSTPGLVASDNSDATKKQALENFMKSYLRELAEGGHTVLGYAITVAKPSESSKNLPSLTPVSVSLQVMPSAEGPDISAEARDRDALLFLEMVGNMTGRSTPAAPLAGSYAWIPQGRAGIMVVHKSAYWERFLVECLKFFIPDTFRLANTIGTWLQSKDLKGDLLQDSPWALGGDNRASEWTATSDHSASLNWSGKSQVEHKESSCWTGTFIETKELKTDISITAEIKPGTHLVEVKAYIDYKFKDHTDNHPAGTVEPYLHTQTIAAQVEWITQIGFNSVDDGVLGTNVTVENPVCKCQADNTTYGILQSIFGGTIPDEGLTNKIKKYLDENIQKDKIASLVNQGLTTRSHFVFSGGGAFLMKEPTFTSECDLQVFLEARMGREKQRQQN